MDEPEVLKEGLSVRERIGNLISGNGRVSELIGRSTITTIVGSLYKSRVQTRTVDETVPDYEYWDKLRRGKLKGYLLGSLFARRIEIIFSSWVFGQGTVVRLKNSGDAGEESNERYTNKLLAEFVESLIEVEEAEGDEDVEGALIFSLYEDHMGLGDQYVVVNADGSLSVPSPDTVTVERDERDYRKILSVTIETRMTGETIKDVYTAESRTVEVLEGNQVKERTVYPNLIGRIPVVHLAHDRSANETNGRSVHETLRPLYDQYDNIIYKQIDGAILLGNPLLAFVGMEDINAVISGNDPVTQDTYQDKDGNTVERTQINIDTNSALLVGKGGDAKFIGPQVGFTADTKQALKSLFLLLLDHTGIPEFVWGSELTSSRATADVQMTQFTRDIEGRQKKSSGWLLKLCKIWLLIQALTDSRVVVDKLEAEWAPLIEEDEDMLLKRVQFATYAGLITKRTALAILQLVKDAQEEIEASEEEGEKIRSIEFPDGESSGFQQRLAANVGEGE